MNRYAIGIAFLAAIIALGAVFFLYPSQTTSADSIINSCRDHPQGAMTCYEKEVPKLYPQQSIPELLSLIREIRSKDTSYQFCHVLAHKLGEAVVAEDPDNWLDAIALNPSDGLCSNGFIHGVIVGRFRNDVLNHEDLVRTIPDFKKACEPRANWDASPLDQAICYHGMGHLFMFITNADILRAVDVCEAVAKSPTGDFMRVCTEGVFMQIYQPLEPDDFALIELLPEKPTKENYRRICSAYDDPTQEGACLREAWPLFDDGIRSGRDVATFCSGQPNETETKACYESASAIVGRMSLGSDEKAANACAKFPHDRQAICFIATAQAILEEDRTNARGAIAQCGRAGGITHECLSTLADRAGFFFTRGSSEHRAFCALFPDDIRERCL